ncbi:MAG: hypothetical protein IKT82_06920 [Bacteroidaceae bacterium]|nr:hypothetical protein [Bacteroidaceae bacterium]
MKDDVFAIAHKALKAMPCSMSVESIFCTADNLVNHLLTHEITEEEYIDYVVDDFEAELNDEGAVFPILTVVFVKLCAIRKANPIAKSIARAFIHRCQRFADFQDLLEALAKVEHQRSVERGRIDLMNYALRTLSKEETSDEDINRLVNATLECSEGVIESAIVSFTIFNNSMNHKYDMQLDALAQGYKDKREGKAVKKIEMQFNQPVGTLVAQANQVTLN